MNRVLAPASDTAGSSIADGFGRRSYSTDPEAGDEVELLELAPALVEHAGFVAALGERVARFASVRHASYAQERRLDRPSGDRLLLVSDYTPGWRLAPLLTAAAGAGLPPDTTVVISILRQLLPAAALFGRHNRESAIGTLAVERLILTPQARLVIAEHAFGPAIEKLNLGRERLWKDFRVAMPPSAGLPRANQRADTNAIGVVALSLLLGRLLSEDEYPGRVSALAESLTERRDGQAVPLSAPLSQWLRRVLQVDVRTAYQTPHEAQVAFETVLSSDRAYVTSPASLEAWVKAAGAAIEKGRGSTRAPVEPAAPVAPAAPAALVEPASASLRPVVMGLAAMVVVLLGVVAWLWTRAPAAPLAGRGELVVQSRPASARVSIDGEDRGVTPLTVPLAAGAHVLEVQIGKSEPRVIPLTIRNGVQTAQYIELQNVPMTGGLDVRSDPPGAHVSIDGQRRGTAPLTLKDLPPGNHDVVLESGGRTVKQAIRIDAGITAQLVVPMPKR